MAARNFYEVDPNIIYPRVDMAGEKTGITGMEFPLFNYLIYLFANVFGWSDWYGRLINLIISSFGVYWFYCLVKKFFSPKMAFCSTFILLNSLWFAYSRKTMPDTFSVALVMGGMLAGYNYLEKGKWWQLLFSFLLVLMGVLSKIPAGYLLVLFAFPALDKALPVRRKILLFLSFMIAFIPVGWWYFIWVPYLVQHYGFWHFYMGTGIIEGGKDLFAHLDEAAEKFYFPALNYIGFTLFIAGIILAIRKKEKRLLWVLCSCFAVFFVFMCKAGFAFYHHNYYILPFVPVMALVAGYTLSMINKPSIRYILMLAVATEIIINAIPEFIYPKDQAYKLTLEPFTARYAAPGTLIAINCDKNPQEIYLTHRKGWNITNDEMQNPAFIADMKNKGCKILIVNKHEINSVPALSYKKLDENRDFVVYEL